MPSEAQFLSAIAGFRLVTANLPRLVKFYRGVLGFATEGAEHAIGSAELQLLGLHGYGRRQALRLGGQSVVIEEYDPPGRPYPAVNNAASLWFQHLALVVTDMAGAYQRVRQAVPISQGGPQLLPVSSGGVHAYKFRDPDGHPLELLQFPKDARPLAWQAKSPSAGQIGLGIDHSAISVADADASIAFYRMLGLKPGEQTHNQGAGQHCLDNLAGVQLTVTPMLSANSPPHLELLTYHTPRGATGTALRANDIAATRIVWQGNEAALLHDPDGHLLQVVVSRQELPQ
jgi:catechol 2,3-dioxygenase-like lactoylglutathione lyase family enzyme